MAKKTWEIWLANVKFEDNPNIVKERPVLIIDDRHAYILSAKITSHPPRTAYQGEYLLKK